MTMLEALNDSNNIKLFLDKKLDFLIEKNSVRDLLQKRNL